MTTPPTIPQTTPPTTREPKQPLGPVLKTSTVGMAILGFAAFLSFACVNSLLWHFFNEPQDSSEEDMQAVDMVIVGVGLIGAGFTAGLIGLCLSPLLAWLLRGITTGRVRVLIAIYASCLLPTALWAWVDPWLTFGASAAIPAIVSVVALSAIVGALARRNRPPDACTNCGYDLAGCSEPGCPECGLGRSESI